MCIVGVSTQTITERDPATPPSDQLMDAVDLITTSNTPKDFAFTYTVCGIPCNFHQIECCFPPSLPPSSLFRELIWCLAVEMVKN